MRHALLAGFSFLALASCGGGGRAGSPDAAPVVANAQAPRLFTPTPPTMAEPKPGYVAPEEPSHPSWSGPLFVTPGYDTIGVYNGLPLHVIDVELLSADGLDVVDLFDGNGGYIPTGALWQFDSLGLVPWHGAFLERVRVTVEGGQSEVFAFDPEVGANEAIVVTP